MRQMKDSGIEWIGEIPEGWEVIRYKHICQILTGFPFKSDCFSNYSGVPLIRIRDITSGAIETFYTGQFDKAYLIKKGTILIGMDGDFNIRLWDNEDALLNQRCCAIYENKKSIKKFLFYTLPFGLNQINKLKYATTVKHLSSNDILNLCAPFPPLSEQQRIADYLDAKCAHIDQCLELTRQSMEKLRAYKLSCITEAVTKGLDPDVPLKDSGVPWISQIPAGWECTRLMTLCSEISTGPFGSQLHAEDYVENQTPLINPSNINNFRIEANYKCTLDSNTVSRLKRHTLYTGEIIFARRGEMGRCALVEKQHEGFICGTGCLKASIKKDINQYYLIYYLQAKFVPYFLEYSSVGTTMNNLNSKTIASIPVTLPPLPEQKHIAAYLDKKCARIDALLEEKQALLDKLAEYKKSLIFECVTGKREVPSCWNR
ncbi:restriction endonuclease subunit S [Desulfovibrio piger]|uniref:restriction endonuclease subunit S n=1 Tax=Desulfovibrio piger TaxID=901 RepID=UPI0026F3200E|nr:restriction endonuclease subunit S [Desulfovibrio piger]